MNTSFGLQLSYLTLPKHFELGTSRIATSKAFDCRLLCFTFIKHTAGQSGSVSPECKMPERDSCTSRLLLLLCRFWDKLHESATHPMPAPWYPPSSRPTDTAYTVAPPPPASPHKPWEGTLREIAPQQQQQQLHRDASPLRQQSQNQPGKQQQAVPQCQHATPLPQKKSAHRPSVNPVSPQSPVPVSRHSSPTRDDKADRPTSAKRQIDRAISAQEWEGFAVAAQLNGQDEERARHPVFGPSFQRAQANAATSTTPPQYLLLPEAESYDSFMLLAHAFRQWRGRAASEQLIRYAAGWLVH